MVFKKKIVTVSESFPKIDSSVKDGLEHDYAAPSSNPTADKEFSPLFPSNELSDAGAIPAMETPVPISVPKWYKFGQRSTMRKDLINKILSEFIKPRKLVDKSIFVPTEIEIKRYSSLLKKLKIKELIKIGKTFDFKYRLDMLDRIRSIDKKKHAAVTIINDNGTLDTFVVHVHTRTFSHNEMTYIVKSAAGLLDPEIKMVHFYYYSNNPFPIFFKKNQLPEGVPDGRLLDDTIEFKVIEALSQIDMSKIINLNLIFTLICFILVGINLLVSLKGFKII